MQPFFNDLFVFAVFCLNFSSIRTAYYPGASLFLACVASVSAYFRSKKRGTRARSSDCGDRSGLNRTQGKRGEISSRLYFLVNFSPALLGSCLFIILGPTVAPENYRLLSFVSFLCFFRYVLFSFFAVRIILECKTTCSISLASKFSVFFCPLQL